MKKYKAILQITFLLGIISALIAGIVFAFINSITLGFIILGSAYLFNAITALNTFVFNKRSDTLIKGTWTLLLVTLPFVGGLLNITLSHMWLWTRKHHRNSDLLKNELFKSDFIPTTGKVEILKNGLEKYNDLFEEIEKAKKTINIQTFIMNGGIIFKQLEELLIKKAKEGVEVRISTDFIGNLQTPNSTYNRLIESGVKFSIFNKVTIPFTTGKSNNRNHDKLIVIDGKIAYTGGINFGDDYSSMYSKYGYWADLHFKLKGEIVREINNKFILDWFDNTKEKLSPIRKSNAAGEDMTMILDFPYKAEKNFLDKLVEKIEQAEESIRFLTPYLVLPNEVTNALIDAATRGVIVNIIITGKADKRIAYRAATRYAEKLSSYGIKVLRTDNFFMHAKVYIFDDKKVMFGTSNLDYRALFHHYETNFESKDKELVKDLISHFNDVAKRSYLLENKSLNWNVFEVLDWWLIKLISPLL